MRCDLATLLTAAAATVSTIGCHRHPPVPLSGAHVPAVTAVIVAKPEILPIKRVVELPGTVQAFEDTALFARVTGYVGKIAEDPGKKDRPAYDRLIDIGSRVKKGQVLAELAVPELEQELQQKEALVKQAETEVVQAEKGFAAAGEGVATATAMVAEAEAGGTRALALYVRWQSELSRISGLVKNGVIDAQTRDETLNQFHAAEAGRNEVAAKVASSLAAVKKAEADRAKIAADVTTAKAKLDVTRSNVGQVNAMRSYLKISAPFDGVVTRRAVSTGDLVSTTEKISLFHVVQIDPLRVVVQVPEVDAGLVAVGQTVRVALQAIPGPTELGAVSRTSWSLEPGSRTLRTEIDLPNPQGLVRPGMYVNATLTVELLAAWTVPAASVGKVGDEAVIYLVDGGKAVRAMALLGRGDGQFTQIRRYKRLGATEWTEINGSEVIAGPASALSDGMAIP